jgi:hypothetical protein
MSGVPSSPAQRARGGIEKIRDFPRDRTAGPNFFACVSAKIGAPRNDLASVRGARRN